MSNNYLVGGEVEGWCTKCKLVLGHTIVALVNNLPEKVKCNTCNGEHKFRSTQAGKGRPRSTTSTRKSKTPGTKHNDYITRLETYDVSKAQLYNINGNFKKDALIDHGKFGFGIVLSIIQDKKIEILFKDGSKILVQNMNK
ncbi:MAG: hypothetical protein PH343_01470 [Nitrospira sp.]|nr:hypothetical protein [Nitrospira sp.]